MTLNALQRANFRRHTHTVEQIIDPETEEPIELGGGYLFHGSADPTGGAGVAGPVGALYVRAPSAGIFVKIGAGDTAWQTLT